MIWIFLVFLALLALLLWIPLVVEIDSEHDFFEVRWGRVVKANMIFSTRGAFLLIAFSGWKKEIALFPPAAQTAQKKQSEPALQKRARSGKAKRKMKWSEWKHLLGVIYRQIKKAIIVKRLHIDWDTDDFSLNAWLYPVFHRLNGHNRQLSINFMGRRHVALLLYTRLGLLAAAGLKVYISSKNAPNHAKKL